MTLSRVGKQSWLQEDEELSLVSVYASSPLPGGRPEPPGQPWSPLGRGL